MHYKNDTKKYLKFNVLTFLVLFFLLYSTIFVQRVNADFENLLPNIVYKTAWQAINEKFYFKSNINLNSWQNKFENKISNLDDAHKCITRLVKVLNDPYTRFLTKEEFKDEQDIINSMLVGIGVKLASNRPIILDVLPESPANKEGIKPNDYIWAVNDRKTYNLNTSEITRLIRGPKDTVLTLTIKRGQDLISKTLKREELKFKAILVKKISDDLALVKIDSFIPENTSIVFKDELLRLMSINGLIIDLRNNSGGLLKNAVEIADMFLSEGKIVSTVTNGNKINQFANSAQLYGSNIVILVNENTASASEILTSALKENKRAVVVGKRTYGKGLVQEIVKLPDATALHVTIAAYLTPSGKNINKIGVVPDEVVYDEEKQIERAKEILHTLLRDNKNNSRIASL